MSIGRWAAVGAVASATLCATLLVPVGTAAPAEAATTMTQSQLYALRSTYYSKLTTIRGNYKAGAALITTALPAPYRARLTTVTTAATKRIAAIATELGAARTQAQYTAVGAKISSEMKLSVSYKGVATLAMDALGARTTAIAAGQTATRAWLAGSLTDEAYAPLAQASGRVAAIAAADLDKVWVLAGTATPAPAAVAKKWTYALDGSVEVPETPGYTAIPGSCALPTADPSWAGNATEPGLHQWITDADVAANLERRKSSSDPVFKAADTRMTKVSKNYTVTSLSSAANLGTITQRVGYNWLMSGDTAARDWIVSSTEGPVLAGPTGAPITDAAIMQGAVTGLDWTAVGGEREQRMAVAIRSLWVARFACMDVDREFVRDPNNTSLIYNSAQFEAGIYLAKFDAAIGAAIAQAAWTSMKPALDALADGGWFEGPTYWNLSSGFLVGAVATAQNVYGSNGPATVPNMAPTAAFAWNATATNGEIPAFADAESENLRENFSSLVARTEVDPYAMALVRRNLVAQPGQTNQWGQSVPTVDSAASMMWWPAEAAWSLPEPARTTAVYPITGLASVQTGSATAWLRGSPRYLSHTHADLGSFALSAKGQEWVVDPGKDSYSLAGYFDLTPTSRRWTYAKVAATGHATVTGASRPVVGAAAPLSKASATSVRVDLTKTIPGATAASRTVTLADRSMTATDKLASRTAQQWTWRWPTTAAVTRGGTATSPTFTLSQGGQKIVITVTGVPTSSTITVAKSTLTSDTGAAVNMITITTPAKTSVALVAKASW